jgi:DNA-binding MarR family transcriptional regulator
MAEIDRIIHAPARLRIMAALIALPPGAQLDFRTLGKSLDLTDGNLGAHLQILEEAGYIKVEKSFVNRKPRTDLAITPRGRARFEEHVAALREICRV